MGGSTDEEEEEEEDDGDDDGSVSLVRLLLLLLSSSAAEGDAGRERTRGVKIGIDSRMSLMTEAVERSIVLSLVDDAFGFSLRW